MQYRSRPNDRSSLGDQRALFDRKPLRQGAFKMQVSRTGRLARTPTVLVADDSDDTRQMLQVLLAAKGYRVLEASDGEQAVEVIQRENPGLVLLDLGLPRLNGLRVINRLRSELKLIDVPLVVISGYDNHFDRALAAGCDDYLVKPIDFDRLKAILDYYVPTRRNAATA
jgi:DNA-binding response OmpR family regulator